VTFAAAGPFSLLPVKLAVAGDSVAIRSFRIDVPEAALVELRRRTLAPRRPDREAAASQFQGLQLATLQALA
jgi:hypothetical protein